jgi:glycosyltransferase involved in cell wall biosynthesis
VHFLGALADVPALHAELDMFVLPTLGRMRMEGCPVALLEAMACSLPCVATDIPGAQDVIEAGISGLLVPPEEPEALAEAIGSLLQSAELRRRLGDAARKRILARYTIEREVADYEALYSEILNTST